MALVEAETPGGPLYHIGRQPDVLAWTEWRFVGRGRFDDPENPGTFRVMYAAEQRLAAFIETLQKWRSSLEAFAALKSVRSDPGEAGVVDEVAGLLPRDWHSKRGIGTFRLQPGQRWLDLRSHETREALRSELASMLRMLGHEDFDLSDAVGRDRRLTQSIARFAVDRGFQGIAYTSRFDSNFDCWALFEGAEFELLDASPIAIDDPDFREAVRLFGLRLS